MSRRMSKLNESFTFNNGVTVSNRIVMAPMTSKGSTWDGIITEEDYEFFGRRAEAAGLLLTGATAVSKYGENFSYQMSIYDDRFIPGLTKLAKLMKAKGSKAIVQLYHSGVNSVTSFEKHGVVYGPSAISFYHLPYTPAALKEDQVWEVVKEFGQATKRVIEAGFDGVEIHGAYSHLIQQFFSSYSNKRDDFWGGTLEKRMNFPIEIVKEVQNVAKQYAGNDFIVGYRLTEQELHAQEVGYTIEESLQLIDRLADMNVTYIHSITKRFGKEIKETINGRTAYLIVPHAMTADNVFACLAYGDLVSIGRAALVEPDFAKKVKEGKEDVIATEIASAEMADSLKFPVKLAQWMMGPFGTNYDIKGIQHFKELGY